MTDNSNQMRAFSCGCIVEWHLDRIKFTNCERHLEQQTTEPIAGRE
ncbi:MAG: hypothetical protein M3258_01565 [Thermoproteota archaeon]|jgi:formate dehydrogenase maturation protein FdhE|nr:hypothetical protein [Thermoproteota archaeon]